MPRHFAAKWKWIGVFQPFGFDLLRSAGVLMSSASICELRSDKSDGPHQKGVFAFHLCSMKGCRPTDSGWSCEKLMGMVACGRKL